MVWVHRKGQVTLHRPNTKHRVEYWVNEEEKKVVYTWYNAYGGTVRIVEWDYSDRLENADSALNRLRDVVGAKRKITSYAGMSVGCVQRIIKNRDVPRGVHIFDYALNTTYKMYPSLPRK